MPAPELNDGEVDVRIRTPLPGSVVLTLGNLMDAVWPGAQLVDGEKGEITFRINKTAQTPVTEEAAAALRVEPEEEDLNINSLGPAVSPWRTPCQVDARLGGPAQRLELEPHRARRLQPGPHGRPLYEAFVSTGLWPPAELNAVPRTIFDDDKNKHFYDQLAWFSKPDGTSLLKGLAYGQRAGTFDFIPHVFRGLSRNEASWRISDHYPLWCEFLVP